MWKPFQQTNEITLCKRRRWLIDWSNQHIHREFTYFLAEGAKIEASSAETAQ